MMTMMSMMNLILKKLGMISIHMTQHIMELCHGHCFGQPATKPKVKLLNG